MRFWLAALVFVAALASYGANAFGVASDRWFNRHQLDAENFVLDGLLHGPGEDGRYLLGRYSRPGNRDDIRTVYERRQTGIDFWRYKSQYGLQLKVFGALGELGLRKLALLHLITAATMSALVAWLFVLVRRDFGLASGLSVAAALVLSPFLVVFARNLYWVSFTWFLPLAICMALGARAYQDTAAWRRMLAWLFCALLAKCLCGYEYLSTIVLAACVPVLYEGLRQQRAAPVVLRKLASVGLVATAAFLLAAGLHARSLAEEGTNGLDYVLHIAEKRLYSGAPEQVAHDACEGLLACEEKMKASLNSNRLKVVSRYFIFRDFVPWIERFEVPVADRSLVRGVWEAPGLARLQRTLPVLSAQGVLALLVLAGGTLVFLAFVAYLGILALRAPLAVRATLLLAFCAPLSWHFIAKGHSFIHPHMNYVLWYLPFIPYGLIFAVQARQRRARAGAVVAGGVGQAEAA